MGNRRDRLSDLPLSIIHEILARLPIRDAIGTCMLSKQWRYSWTTLPHLDFSPPLVFSPEYRRRRITENFISNALLHHRGPIHSFEVSSIDINIDSIEKWMLCLSNKDVRELILWVHLIHHRPPLRGSWPSQIFNFTTLNLKSSIYSFVKLTKLSLAHCTFDPLPSSFTGFLALTDLQLYDIELSTDEVESLVACCPLLETLDMTGCSCSQVRICSPNLKTLHLAGEHKGLFLYAPLLAKMTVDCPLSTVTETLVSNYTNLLGCFTNLVEMTGDGHFVQYLSVGINSCHRTLVLYHLRVIVLRQVGLADTKQQSVVARLIFGAPNLHKLLITGEFCEIGYGSDTPYVSFEDFGCEPNFRLEKLREVSLYSVCDYRFGMHLIKLLLERSPVLETVDLHFISPQAAAELLGFHRSSTNARILVESIID